MFDKAIKELKAGRSVEITPRGNSMTPLINSGDKVTLVPIEDKTKLKKRNIVLAKVNGQVYLHLISAIAKDRVQISNNHGKVNGWTSFDNVYGVVPRRWHLDQITKMDIGAPDGRQLESL